MNKSYGWLALLLLIAPEAQSKNQIHWQGCVELSSFQRRGSVSRWVEARPSDSLKTEAGKIILSLQAWKKMLHVDPSNWNCGLFIGRYQGSKQDLWVSDFKSHPITSKRDHLLFFRKLRLKLEIFRESVSQQIRGWDEFGVFRKLILNESTPRGPEPIFRLLGFVHVYSAAGIHLYAWASLVYALAYALVRRKKISVEGGLRTAGVISGLGWMGAWILQGLRPGLLRPLVIVLLRSAAIRLGLKWRIGAPLILSLLLDLTVALFHSLKGDPQAWAPGRWHYALAVGGGLAAAQAVQSRSVLKQHAALSVGSWLTTALWDGATTGWVSIFTPLASLATIPLCASVGFPAAMMAVVFKLCDFIWISDLIWKFNIQFMDFWIEFWAMVSLRGGFLWSLTGMGLIAGGVLASVCLRFSWKWKAAMILICLLGRGAGTTADFLNTAKSNIPLGAQTDIQAAQSIHQLNVGQGDAALIVGSDTGMIDVGSEKTMSPAHWMQILRDRGVFRLDWVALTHLDEDHRGGLVHLVKLLPITCVTTSTEEWNTERGKKFLRFLEDQNIVTQDWSGDCYPYFVLGPGFKKAGRAQRPVAKGNAAMSAFAIPLVERKSLYVNAGDSDQNQEKQVLNWLQAKKMFQADHILLKISHHGSRHSSSDLFLETLHPEMAWISAGIGNPHGHPSPWVLEKLIRLGIAYRRTDRDGDLRWEARQQKSIHSFCRWIDSAITVFKNMFIYKSNRPPSMIETSPVIHEASSLNQNRIVPATSLGSPTLPRGNAAPRFA